MNRLWEELDQDAFENKASHTAYLKLKELYSHWDRGTQDEAVEVLVEWLSSENARKRFDALSLIDEFDIVDARAGLESFASSLSTRSDTEGKYELKRVRDILQRL